MRPVQGRDSNPCKCREKKRQDHGKEETERRSKKGRTESVTGAENERWRKCERRDWRGKGTEEETDGVRYAGAVKLLTCFHVGWDRADAAASREKRATRKFSFGGVGLQTRTKPSNLLPLELAHDLQCQSHVVSAGRKTSPSTGMPEYAESTRETDLSIQMTLRSATAGQDVRHPSTSCGTGPKESSCGRRTVQLHPQRGIHTSSRKNEGARKSQAKPTAVRPHANKQLQFSQMFLQFSEYPRRGMKNSIMYAVAPTRKSSLEDLSTRATAHAL